MFIDILTYLLNIRAMIYMYFCAVDLYVSFANIIIYEKGCWSYIASSIIYD